MFSVKQLPSQNVFMPSQVTGMHSRDTFTSLVPLLSLSSLVPVTSGNGRDLKLLSLLSLFITMNISVGIIAV